MPTTETIREIGFTIKVAESDIVNALAAGAVRGPHGYFYWCGGISQPKGPGARTNDIEGMARALLNGWTLRVIEQEEGRFRRTATHELTLPKLIAGIGMWLATSGGNYSNSYNESTGVFDLDIDAPASDLILQFAIFGKQVYG